MQKASTSRKTSRHRWPDLRGPFLGLLVATSGGCTGVTDVVKGPEGLQGTLQQAINTLQNGIDMLDRQSSAWQSTLMQVEADLFKQLNSTLANEVQNLVTRGIAQSGVEARCGADFLGHRMKEGLQAILAKLQGQTPALPKPTFCQVAPDRVDVSLTRSSPGTPARIQVVSFFGYDVHLSTPQRVKAFLHDSRGSEAEIPSSKISTPTAYELTVTVADGAIQFQPTSDQIILRWGNTTISSVAVVPGIPEKCGGAGESCCADRPCTIGACRSGHCPSFSIDTAEPMELAGAGPGAAPFRDKCPAGMVAMGFTGRSGAEIDRVALQCAPLSPAGELGAPITLPTHGFSTGGQPYSIRCRNGVIVGLSGGAGSRIDRIGGHCWSIGRLGGDGTSTEQVIVTGGGSGGPYEQFCPAGYVMVGISGGAGERLHQINLLCSRLIIR